MHALAWSRQASVEPRIEHGADQVVEAELERDQEPNGPGETEEPDPYHPPRVDFFAVPPPRQSQPVSAAVAKTHERFVERVRDLSCRPSDVDDEEEIEPEATHDLLLPEATRDVEP